MSRFYDPGTAAQATFKWSRDNGSVVTAISNVSGSTLTVASLGPDTELGFAANQWVELTDDTNALHSDPPEQPGVFAQIKVVDATQTPPTITLTAAPNFTGAAGHAKARRWDQGSPPLKLNAGTMQPLENGVQVQFSVTGVYNSGDYWLIPARTSNASIDWPQTTGANPSPIPQKPTSTNVHVAALPA